MTLAWSVYRLAASGLGAVAPAAWWLASPAERAFWSERMGEATLTGGCHAWIHGASLGEANAVLPLVRELEPFQPRARLVLTATTRTGRVRLAGAGHPARIAPVDTPQAVRRFFSGIQPQRLLIVETELWPHWLMRARSEGIPVAIVSARLSARSLRRYRLLGRPLRQLVEGLGGVLCQSEADAARWREAGARPERVAVVGNLKTDALPVPAASRPGARLALGLDPERPLLVLGSVRPGELLPFGRAWNGLPAALRQRWQVAVVPRHARAVAELREEAARAGLGGAVHAGNDPWTWDARSGVLNDYYAAAEVAFVGGSLRPYGGHNPLEPAAAGAAVVMGPHLHAQLPAVEALRAAGGLAVVSDAAGLGAVLARLLGEGGERKRLAAGAASAVAHLRGAARRAVHHLVAWRLWPVS